MRRTVTPSIQLSMYRHFAIVSVLLTAGLAMFVQGENGEAAKALMLQEEATAAPAASRPQ